MATPAAIKEARSLLLINLAGYVGLVLTGAVVIDDGIGTGYIISDGSADENHFLNWTAASGFANLFAMVAGVVGAAAALSGIHQVRAWSWSQGSLPAAAAYTGFMAWLLTLLALGLGIKEVLMGASVYEHRLGSTKIVLEATPYLIFAIPRALLLGVLSLTQLRYLQTSIFHTAP